jgi:hypothetical protein
MRKYTIIGVLMATILLAVSTFYALTPKSQVARNKAKEAQPGEIRGRVVDAQGQPVPQAKLHLLKFGDNPTGRIVFYPADEQGNFTIKGIAYGVYDIFVSAKEAGYADTDIKFYKSDELVVPQVAVSEKQPTPFLTVHVGPKTARIVGHVVNAVNGAPIVNATMTFSRPENQFMVLTTSLNQPDDKGGYNFLLPSAPLTIKVTAPGYADWSYRNEGSNQKMDLLTLEPGQTKELTIRMRPLR